MRSSPTGDAGGAARAALLEARSSSLVAVAGGDGTIRDGVERPSPAAASRWPSSRPGRATCSRPRSGSRAGRGRSAGSRRGGTGRLDVWGTGVAGRGDARAPGEPAGRWAFVVACGVGFDARVMAAATPDLKRRLGFLAYVVVGDARGGPAATRRFRIEADDEIHELRGPRRADRELRPADPGPRRPAPPDRPGRRLLDVFVVQGTGTRAGSSALAERASPPDPPPHRRSRAPPGPAVRVTSDPAEPVQVDGDAHEARWLEANASARRADGPAAVIRLRACYSRPAA